MKKYIPVLIFAGVVLVFFWQLFLKGLMPIPSDTIVGLYYPFRDAYFKTNPNGLPYKNFLVTDPVRQQYPWKNLSINLLGVGQLPLWNPYNFAGGPLLANFQSAVFYPLNLLFFIMPFILAWSILILLEPLLCGIFLYFYLKNLRLNNFASFLGAVSFSFSGFFIAWLEWGTVLNTALWLPLILLSIDKIFGLDLRGKIYDPRKSLSINLRSLIIGLKWPAVFVFALTSSFLAGHLQVFFYLSLMSFAYFLVRWYQSGMGLRALTVFVICSLFFVVLTVVQWLPTLEFILLSARGVDVTGYTTPGWFIPWQNIVQFLAPDFFGNPATLNYYGIWNYAEFVGYIGMLPLIIASFALFFRRDKKTLFFGSIFFLSLIFAFPTIFAKVPFKFQIPFISTSQPTRLLFLTDFSLAVLASLGLDYFMKLKDKKAVLYILAFFLFCFAALWGFILVFHGKIISPQDLSVSRHNLVLPTVLFILSSAILVFAVFNKKEKIFNKNFPEIIVLALIAVTVFDLFRFGWKFEPFTRKQYLFPSTKVTSFLQKQKGPFRVLSVDSRILPPNFSIMYKIETLDGYDPLYLRRYGELMAASARGKPDISAPFGFNRIITPQDPLSRISNLLGIKYVLSLNKLNYGTLKLVFSDGVINVYENSAALPEAFFINDTYIADSKQSAIDQLFNVKYQLNSMATVENVSDKGLFIKSWSSGTAQIVNYTPNIVIIKTQNGGEGFLVLTDSFYPSWHATVDGMPTKIYLTDYNFRGIIVPKGEHTIVFQDSLF